MPCPGSLPAPRRSQRSASSSSSAPAASPPAGRTPSRANRQLRIWPSAVSRTRSQAPQNGRVTEPMTPDPAGPPSTRNSLGRGAARARPVVGSSVEARPTAGEDLVGGDHVLPAPAVLGVQRHLLDEPQLVPALQAVAQQRHGLVVVDPAHQHRVDLDRGEPGRGGRRQAGQHVGQPVAVGELLEASRGRGCPARR